MNRFNTCAIFLCGLSLLSSVSCSTTKPSNSKQPIKKPYITTSTSLSHSIEYFAEISPKFLEECPFSKGDDISAVKSFYGIEAEPRKSDRNELNIGPNYIYNFSEQIGVWVFFDENKKISSMRFQKPFTGLIAGVPPGASKQTVKDKKGPPERTFDGFHPLDTFKNSNRILSDSPLPRMTAWTYSDPSFVRYDHEKKTELIQVILSHSCAPGS